MTSVPMPAVEATSARVQVSRNMSGRRCCSPAIIVSEMGTQAPLLSLAESKADEGRLHKDGIRVAMKP
jgi:hypothetical protein